MPWTCPGCRTTIIHTLREGRPRPGIVYRCYVCRLELQLNQENEKLELVPLPIRHEGEREFPKS